MPKNKGKLAESMIVLRFAVKCQCMLIYTCAS